MAQSGWQFAADLSELKTIGVVDMPAMAATFAALNNALAATADHDIAAFSMETTGFDQVYGPWAQLRDDVQNILGKTSANMDTAGGVLNQIVEMYANTDDEAARSLRDAWRNGPPSLQDGETLPPADPPTVILK